MQPPVGTHWGGIDPTAPTPTPAPQGPGGLLGGLEHAAPTIGSVLGGIGGTALGAMVPGADLTGVPEFAGGVAGASAGGALGQKLENALTGSKASTLGAGVEGGVGQAIGGGLVAGAGALLSKVGGSAIADSSAQALAKKLLLGQLNARNLPAGVDAEKAAQTLMDNGIYDLRKAPDALSTLTGGADNPETGEGTGIYTGGTNRIVGGMQRAKTKIYNDYVDTARNSISGGYNPASNALTPDAKSNAAETVAKVLSDNNLINQNIGGGTMETGAIPGGKLDGTNPTDVHLAMKQFRKLSNAQSTSETGKGLSSVYRYMADQMSSHLLEHPGAQITPEIRNDLLEQLDSSGLKTSYPKMYAKAAKTIENAQQAKDLNNAQTELVNAKMASQAPIKRGESGAMTSGDVMKLATKGAGVLGANAVGGPLVGGGMLAAEMAAGNPAVEAGATKLAANAPGIMQGVGNALKSTPAMATGGALGAGVVSGAGATVGNQSSNGSASNAAVGGGSAMQQQQGAGGGGSIDSTPLANQLTNMEQMMAGDPLLAQALAPQIAAMSQRVQNINMANQAIEQYQQTLQQAGGGQGAVGGLLAKLGGLFGGPAAQVGPEATAAQNAIKNAGGPAMTLPGLTSTGPGVQQGLGQAQSVLAGLGTQ